MARLRLHEIVACAAALLAIGALTAAPFPRNPQQPQSPASPPTFYRDVLPILQQHCQRCHRPEEIAPFPLLTYDEARLKAREVRDAVQARAMPPWLAEPGIGHFSNDPSLSRQEIATVAAWVDGGASAGNPHDAPPAPHWAEGWMIPKPDLVITMPKPVALPAHGDVEYTYEIVPTGFKEDRWVQMSEVRPSSRAHVHHGVVYVRPPDSKWLRGAPVGVPFTADDMLDEQDRRDAHWTNSEILLVYAPGSSPDEWPAGLAKFIPAGSDLVFQMHYTTNGHAAEDQTSIGLVFAKQTVKQRVLTVQLTNDTFVIPPGDPDYRAEVHGTLPNDATLLGFFPHMHLRGKRFEYNILHSDGSIEPLLRVRWNFFWQLSYRLTQPRPLKGGTELQAVGWFDNSLNNPHNPDPDVAVRWGDQTYDEMMVGFLDLAVPPDYDKTRYFMRDRSHPPGR